MRRKLKLSFYQPRTWIDVLPWGVIIAAAVGLCWQIVHYQQLSRQAARQQAQLTHVPIMAKPLSAPSEQENNQYQKLQLVVEQINRPILQLHSVLGIANHPDIAVLAIEESGSTDDFSLTVEAQNMAALQAYWEHLNHLPQLTNVRLIERSQRSENNYAVTRATLRLHVDKE